MNVQVEVFWIITPHSVVVGYQRFRDQSGPPSSKWNEDGGSMALRNFGILPQHYEALRPQLEDILLL